MAFSSDNTNGWTGDNCTVRKWMNGAEFYDGSVFSGIEKTAIAETALKAQSQYTCGVLYPVEFKDVPAINDVFCLSAAEAEGLYANDNARKKTGGRGEWWLRSAYISDNLSSGVGDVGTYGGVATWRVYMNDGGVSPAFNLKLSSILFASESGMNKASALAAVSGSTAAQWKLTLRDSSKTVQVTDGQSVTKTDTGASEIITVPYIYTDTNTANPVSQISVMITDKAYDTDSAQILYYGALQNTTITGSGASGTGIFTLPAELTGKVCGKDYYAYIIAEDVNGEKQTDYASKPAAITIPPKKYTVTVTNGTLDGGSTTGDYAQGETVTITAGAAPKGQQFKEWKVVSGSITLAGSTSETTTFTMPAEAVSVQAVYKKSGSPGGGSGNPGGGSGNPGGGSGNPEVDPGNPGSDSAAAAAISAATSASGGSYSDSALTDGRGRKDDVPKTGEDTPGVWLSALTLASGAGLLLTGKKRKNVNSL